MKKRLLLFLFTLLASQVCRAQLLWLHGGVDIMSITQKGTLFIVDPASPSSFVTPTAVDRGFTHFGIVVEGFYPINFLKDSYSTFGTGPVMGISLTSGQRKISLDPAYQPQEEKFFNNGTGNLRIPMFWSFRTGNMIDYEKSRLGFEGAAGMQLMHFNTADEIGWALFPALRAAVQYKRISLTLNYFPTKYVSYYNTEEGQVKRLSNQVFSMEFKYAFDWYLGRVD